MKTLKNTLGIEKNRKTINSFSSNLDISVMIIIKGGDGDPIDPLWPPAGPVIFPIPNN